MKFIQYLQHLASKAGLATCDRCLRTVRKPRGEKDMKKLMKHKYSGLTQREHANENWREPLMGQTITKTGSLWKHCTSFRVRTEPPRSGQETCRVLTGSRLVSSGCLQEVIKGWFIPSRPDEVRAESTAESTAWYASFWRFCAIWKSDFRRNEAFRQSLSLHAGNWTVPRHSGPMKRLTEQLMEANYYLS